MKICTYCKSEIEDSCLQCPNCGASEFEHKCPVNVYFNSVRFKQAASFSSMMSGNYTVQVSRSARPETTLVTTTVSMRPRRI